MWSEFSIPEERRSSSLFQHLPPSPFRARTRVVLKKVFHNSGSFIPFRTHSGKVVESRAIIFLDAWSFADFRTFIFQTFGSLVFFLAFLTVTCLLSVPGILAAPLTSLSCRTIHHHGSVIGLQCCKPQWLSRARIF